MSGEVTFLRVSDEAAALINEVLDDLVLDDDPAEMYRCSARAAWSVIGRLSYTAPEALIEALRDWQACEADR